MSLLIFGSSHVKRFLFYTRDRDLNSRNIFNLVQPLSSYIYGISGGRVDNTDDINKLETLLLNGNFNALFLHIGGNDLDINDANDQNVEELIFKLLSIASAFASRFKLKRVYIFQLIQRMSTRHCPVVTYNQLVIKANKLLKSEIIKRGLRNIIYWKFKGLKQSQDPVLCDGVHMNELGYLKYYNAMKGAAVHLRNFQERLHMQ